MFSSRLISRFCSLFVLVLMLLPAFANAQESPDPQPEANAIQVNQISETFGGWRMGGNLMFGTGPFDHVDNYVFGGLLQYEAGYLWGNHVVFLGPVVNLGFGFPMLLNADIRLKMVFPVSESNALSFSAGFGGAGNCIYSAPKAEKRVNSKFRGNSEEENEAIKFMYIPIQIGFEHVFDNSLILGAAAQINLAFYNQRYEYYSSSSYSLEEQRGSEYKVKAMVGTFAVGIHVGYKY